MEGCHNARPLRMTWNDVTFDEPLKYKVSAGHAEVHQGPGPVNLPLSGDDVRITGTSGESPPNAGIGKFVPVPASVAAATIRQINYFLACWTRRFTG